MANLPVHSGIQKDRQESPVLNFSTRLGRALLQYAMFLGVGMTGAALLMLILARPAGDESWSVLLKSSEILAVCIVNLFIIKRPLMLLFAWFDETKRQDSALSFLFRLFDSLSAMMTGEALPKSARKRA